MDEILNRRSIRKYDLSKKVSRETLTKLCEYAEAAPSARNQSSREYVVVDDKEIINKLSIVAKGTMILSECDSLIVVVGKDPSDLAKPEMQPQDLAAATENILIAATKMKLGSCWCGIYPIVERIALVNDILNIYDGRFAFSIVAIGYPLNEDDFKDRHKFSEELVHYNRG